MIASIWHGKTRTQDAVAYVEYLLGTGVPEYRSTAVNKGARVLRQVDGDMAHFITLSFWESLESITAFAGADISLAGTTRRILNTCSNLNQLLEHRSPTAVF